MKNAKQFLLLLLMASVTSLSFAQVRQVNGTVSDNQGAPVIGASVLEKGTNNGVATDENGRFSISVTGTNSVLVVSSVGFQTVEFPVGSSLNPQITLLTGSGDLDEVVVTALGIKRAKKSLGYAVQEVKGGDLSDRKETNVTNALTGKVAGLQIVKSSNGAGGSAKMILRGFNSLTNDNQPLIVVDGVPINNFTGTTENGYWGAGFDMGNGLGDISADDIESMSVLKGPSAAALYGSRAGNGVIQITTKSGRKNPGLGINVSVSYGVESIFTQPNTQNLFGQGSDGLYVNDGTQSWGPKATGQSVTKWDGTTGPLSIYDNVDNYVRNGTHQNYNVSFQQQVGRTNIYTSFNRLEDRSILPGNKLERTNLTTRVTNNFGPNEKWTTDVKVQYNNTQGFNRPINGRDWSSTYVLNLFPRSMDIRDFKAATNEFGGMLWFGGSSSINPYWRAQYDKFHDYRDRFIMTGSVKYAIADWLDAEVKGGADLYSEGNDNKVWAGSPLASTGRFSLSKGNFLETNYSAMLTARKDNFFENINANLTLGGNLMSQRSSSLGSSVGLLEVPNLFSLNNGVSNPSVSQGMGEKKINSVFGSLGVDYKEIVYLDLTFRNDWSSTLHKDNRSYFYPSANLAVILSEMLYETPSWLSYAKLRASYAQVGSDMGPYQLYNVYSIGKDPLGNTTANTQSVYYDPFVVNELISNLEFGAELRFFNNRLGLDLSWYKTNSTNQLINLPMDPTSGYDNRKINAGNIQNSGFEIVADVNIMDRVNSGFSWNMNANFSNNKNEVIDILTDENVNQYTILNFDDMAVKAVAGGNYGEIWGHLFQRVDDKGSPHFGKLILDPAGLPQRDGTQRKIGDQQANFLLGITNSFTYKNFGFSFMIDGRFGGEMFSATQVAMYANGTAAGTVVNGERAPFVVEGVISDGTGGYVQNTQEVDPQVYWNRVGRANNLGIHEAFLYDASNIRLRNVQLSYMLPKGSLGSAFQRVRLTASCNNVWMISSNMLGIDPESSFATGSNAVGFENGAPPTMRTFLFGISASF